MRSIVQWIFTQWILSQFNLFLRGWGQTVEGRKWGQEREIPKNQLQTGMLPFMAISELQIDIKVDISSLYTLSPCTATWIDWNYIPTTGKIVEICSFYLNESPQNLLNVLLGLFSTVMCENLNLVENALSTLWNGFLQTSLCWNSKSLCLTRNSHSFALSKSSRHHCITDRKRTKLRIKSLVCIATVPIISNSVLNFIIDICGGNRTNCEHNIDR